MSAPRKSLKDHNVIVVVIDALRADHLGCYGYGRDTSPFIDSIAARAVLFEQALSNSSYTRESVSVLLSGLLPSKCEGTGVDAKPPGDTANFGECLKEAGYRTGFFVLTPVLKNPNFAKGFDEAEDLSVGTVRSREGPALSARAVEFVKGCGDQKFAMYLHYLDPHGPYEPPEEFYLRFAETVYPKPVKMVTEVRRTCPQLLARGFGPGHPRFDDMVLRYDAEIAHTDHSLEMLFGGLDELGVLDGTLVVITADHGEEFLEHQFVEHAWTLYQESLRVPMVFWAPGVLEARRVSSLVSTVDLLPTLLDLMEVRHQREGFDGSSLFARHGDELRFVAPSKPFIAELLFQSRSVLRAVIQDDWKYIAAQKWLGPSARGDVVQNQKKLINMYRKQQDKRWDIWGPIVHQELYFLGGDPQERWNLLGGCPETQQALGEVLEAFEEDCRLRVRDRHPQSDESETLSPEEIERLEALGHL